MQNSPEFMELSTLHCVVPASPRMTVFISRLMPSVQDDFIKSILELCGPICSWKRALDPDSNIPKSFAFCDFLQPEGLLRALRLLHKLPIHGQDIMLKIDPNTRHFLEQFIHKKRLEQVLDSDGPPGADIHGVTSNYTEEFGIMEDEDRRIDKCVKERIMYLIEQSAKMQENTAQLHNRLAIENIKNIKWYDHEIGQYRKHIQGVQITEDIYMQYEKLWQEREKAKLKHRKLEEIRENNRTINRQMLIKHEESMNGKCKDEGVQTKRAKHPVSRPEFISQNKANVCLDPSREKVIFNSKSPSKPKYAGSKTLGISVDGKCFRPLNVVDAIACNIEDEWNHKIQVLNSETTIGQVKDRLYSESSKVDESNMDSSTLGKDIIQNHQGCNMETDYFLSSELSLPQDRTPDIQILIKEEERTNGKPKDDRKADQVQTKFAEQTTDLFLSTMKNLIVPGLAPLNGLKARAISMDERCSRSPKVDDAIVSNIKGEWSHKIKVMNSETSAQHVKDHINSNLSKTDQFNVDCWRVGKNRTSNDQRSKMGTDHCLSSQLPLPGIPDVSSSDHGTFNDYELYVDSVQVTNEALNVKGTTEQPQRLFISLEDKEIYLKKLIDILPSSKEELFCSTVDWSSFDKHCLHDRVRLWVSRKIEEFVGEEEATLIDFIVSCVRKHMSPAHLLELLENILDEEAELFVKKLWKLILYELRKIEVGV